MYDQALEDARELGNYDSLLTLKESIDNDASAFRQLLVDSEPLHLTALNEFASRAFRRPLSDKESQSILTLYRDLRRQDVSHEDAFRISLAQIFVAPAFLYRIEVPPGEPGAAAVTDWELATRLSSFLWSSTPDDELRAVAASGRLRDTDVLAAQTKRMLADGKTRRLALEFACQWLHIRDFDKYDEKSERHFPQFPELRDDMHEESIRFFTHLFQSNRSILDILDCDYTFLNEELAPLRHSQRIGTGMAFSSWRKKARSRRGTRAGNGACFAIGRIANKPYLAGNMDQRRDPRRTFTQAAEGRSTLAGGSGYRDAYGSPVG